MTPSLPRRATAEFVGTTLLMSVVTGSALMSAKICGGNAGLELLACSVTTGAALTALIMAFGPISGGHFNPVVTLSVAVERGLAWGDVPAFLVAQILGAIAGVAVAHGMFGKALLVAGVAVRQGAPLLFSELVATFGLMCVVWACARMQAEVIPFAVGAYVAAGYWFTSSTGFVNPAVTLARAFTDSSAGMRLVDVPAYVVAQLIGGGLATALFRWLVPALPEAARDVVVPHDQARP